MDGYECAGFDFFSNFDSANLAKVESVPPSQSVVSTSITGKIEVPDVEFNIWTKPDCGGTEFQNGNRTWFYFAMKGSKPSLLVKFNIVDLNKQAKMYSQGMAPVYRVVPGKNLWDRIRDKPIYSTDEDVFTLSFKFKTPENINSIMYFAFTYPYSYTDLQGMLSTVDTKFSKAELLSKDDIYYVRECVCNSLEGRRVDLITISSYHNISHEREIRLKQLFPDNKVMRPFKFIGKKVIYVSARVHPGETPSSFVFNGLLNLLLNREDIVAVALRKNYVFKLIPFLNPDGVANGHYRTDTKGINLNRVYLQPSITHHPTIYAARALIRYYHYGFEKEDDFSDNNEDNNKLSNIVSNMKIDEKNKFKKNSWCCKCKNSINKLEDTMPGISTIIPTFNHNPLSTDKNVCRNCGDPAEANENVLVQGDAVTGQQIESGLFLYIDMHGHASKKGIFMYGNHFDDVENSVECMLLPKIMSINNHNFHFTACNFTEKNMYLKDKRDGMSREGSGRVAVYKLTGLVRSYTLECNYNTGRLVNVLPPTIKESSRISHTLAVPPKYNPSVFEEVGRAIGSSILDLSTHNPITRLPHSEYHSLNGLREWLRLNSTNNQGEVRASPNKFKIRQSASLHQGRASRTIKLKTRSTISKYGPKKLPKTIRSSNMSCERNDSSSDGLSPQPSCSNLHTPPSTTGRSRTVRTSIKTSKSLNRPRAKKELSSNKIADKPKSSNSNVNHIARNIHNASSFRQKNKIDLNIKIKETQEPNKSEEQDRIKLKEICFIKDTEGKKVIAKYQTNSDKEVNEENLIVAWDPTNAHKPQVYTHKTRVPAFLSSRASEEGGAGRSGAFRVHNFSKTTAKFNKVIRNKRVFKKRLTSTDANAKLDKIKKRKKIRNKN